MEVCGRGLISRFGLYVAALSTSIKMYVAGYISQSDCTYLNRSNMKKHYDIQVVRKHLFQQLLLLERESKLEFHNLFRQHTVLSLYNFVLGRFEELNLDLKRSTGLDELMPNLGFKVNY